MHIYDSIALRLRKEDNKKKELIYKFMGGPLVTRFFPTFQAYPENRNFALAQPLSPTMFTPWGKVLGPSATVEQMITSQATFIRAIASIPAQLLYDALSMVFYTLIALPSLLIGMAYFIHGSFIEENQEKQKKHLQFVQHQYLGNVVLPAYFALAMVIDFIRELCAIFSRTYGTLMQTDEEKKILYCAIG